MCFKADFVIIYFQANNEADYKSCEVSLRKEKVPRKIIHCSDGVIEEYSSDEDEPPEVTNKLNPVIFQILCVIS
jgi:hypothetical protein